MISRFAPSPTGRLHLGHAWSALCVHDQVRAAGGQFLLRIEDIDTTRCRPVFDEAIVEDMRWLGLAWDGEIIRQSARRVQYEEALARLQAMGLIYRCVCTRTQVGSGPYRGTCRGRGHAEGAWRLDVASAYDITGPLSWEEQGHGLIAADPRPEGDIVIARRDIGTSYHLAVTVDDAAQSVTHVIRGRDLFSATPVQRLLQTLLGFPEPCYWHHPLIAGGDGTRLAKRKQSPTLAALRAEGMVAAELVGMMRLRRFPVGFGLLEG